MLKTMKESYRLGLVFALNMVLFSEFWDWFIFVAFPNRPRSVSNLALIIVSPLKSFDAFNVFVIFYTLVLILFLAWGVSKVIGWLGEETHTGPGAGWRLGLLGFLLSLGEFSELFSDATLYSFILFFLAYWLLFRKFGLNRTQAAA